MLNRAFTVFSFMSLLALIGGARADLPENGEVDSMSCGPGHAAAVNPGTEHV